MHRWLSDCAPRARSFSVLQIRLNFSWRGKPTIFSTARPTIPGTSAGPLAAQAAAKRQQLPRVVLREELAATAVVPSACPRTLPVFVDSSPLLAAFQPPDTFPVPWGRSP